MKYCYLILFALYFSKPASAQCDAGFTYTVSEPFVFFYPSDSSADKNHFWYMGDGTEQTTLSPRQSYSPGTYQVKHVISDTILHCKDSVTQEVTINYQPQCYSSFYYIRSPADPNHITFYPSAYAYGTNITQLTWSVNGVAVSGSSNEWEYSFSPPSQYVIALTVSTAGGCSSIYTDTITTFRQCEFDFDYETRVLPTNARAIMFEPVPRAPSLRYSLTTMGAVFPCCQYNTFSDPGSYTVTMVATDSITGCFDTITHVIAVKGNAYDSCTATLKATEKTNGQYQLAAISNQQVTGQHWKICDTRGVCDSMLLSSGASASYSFKDTGYYTVRLAITTQTGCTREVADIVHVQSTVGSTGMRLSSYPNPAQNETTVYVGLDEAAPVTVTVYNNTGKIVHNKSIPALAGKNKIAIPVQSLPKGQYYVNIQSGGHSWKSVFQKL
ncbi:MAG: T9SS type A sorting domain-containing protein [Agriterribacter sp.]